jgi:hypothetical protein
MSNSCEHGDKNRNSIKAINSGPAKHKLRAEQNMAEGPFRFCAVRSDLCVMRSAL